MANGKFLLLVIVMCWCAGVALVDGSLLARLPFVASWAAWCGGWRGPRLR